MIINADDSGEVRSDFLIVRQKIRFNQPSGKISFLLHAVITPGGESLCKKVSSLKTGNDSYSSDEIWKQAHCSECIEIRHRILSGMGLSFNEFRETEQSKRTKNVIELGMLRARPKESYKVGNSIHAISGGLPSLGKKSK